MNNMRLVSFLLRVGVASVFLYAAVSAFLSPYSWVGFFPVWMRGIVSDELLLNGFGVCQLATALWVLSGKKLFWSSMLSNVLLFLIVVVNIGALDIVFRDIAILFASLALTVSSRDGVHEK